MSRCAMWIRTGPPRSACQLQGGKANQLSGRVLTAPEMNAHNTFDDPKRGGARRILGCSNTTADGFSATLPPKSVVVVAVKSN